MNRRHLLQGSVLTLAIVAGTRHISVLGQTPEASPEPPYDPYCDGTPGFVVSADSTWDDPSDPRRGVFRYFLRVTVYDSEENAKNAYAAFPQFLDGYLRSLQKDNQFFVGERRRVSAPQVGEQAVAELVNLMDEDRDRVEMARAFVRNGSALYSVMGFGYSAIIEPYLAFVGTAFHFQEFDPDDDDSILALLPTVFDMPEGFSLTTTSIYRGGEETFLRGDESTVGEAECVRPLEDVAFSPLSSLPQ